MSVTPMFPLEVAMLPGEQLPLRIFEPRYSAMIADCLAADRAFGVVLIAAGREVGGGDARNDVGALARLLLPGKKHISIVATRERRSWGGCELSGVSQTPQVKERTSGSFAASGAWVSR